MNFEQMTNTDIMLKEIDLIQDCVKRMASNSFSVKRWNIAVIAACVTLAKQQETFNGYIVAIVACLVFWWMDSYYLRIERMYRRKYEWVLQNRLHSFEYAFDLNPANREMWLAAESHGAGGTAKSSVAFYAVQWSPTLRNCYFPIIIVLCFCLVASDSPLMLKGLIAVVLSCIIFYGYRHKNDWE